MKTKTVMDKVSKVTRIEYSSKRKKFKLIFTKIHLDLKLRENELKQISEKYI